jgi:integrase
VLSDFEICTIWNASDEFGVFGALVKTLILTAQRRDEVARMTYGEIGADGIWTIPPERYKTKKPNHVPLSKQALAIIQAQPRTRSSDHVFASNAGTSFSGFSKNKAALDRVVQGVRETTAEVEPMSNWRLHDLRRTAKTLMQRAGVRPDISERVLGHVISGVEGTYDRYAYVDEKRDALGRLAEMIERIASQRDGEALPPAKGAKNVR